MSTPKTTMKLSEAIRLGAMLKPQWFGRGGLSYDYTRTCAIQAAFDAVGQLGHQVPAFTLWPVIQLSMTCPEKCAQAVLYESDLVTHVGNAIIHLNDVHLWTRERIADWVATIEAQQEQQAKPVALAMEVAQQ